MTTDRDLTERAARALGAYQDYTWVDTPFFTGLQRRNFDSPEDGGLEIQTSRWAPLEDERDAFRLAVQLRMRVEVNEHSVVVYLLQDNIRSTQPAVIEYPAPAGGHVRATCRAIVRAAAQLAKLEP